MRAVSDAVAFGAWKYFDPIRFEAFEELLARKDPKGLPRRGHVARWQGDPNRRGTRLPGIVMAWMQRRHLEADVEESVAPDIRQPLRSSHRELVGLQFLCAATTH